MIRKAAFLVFSLCILSLAVLAALPPPAKAWAICHEGTYDWSAYHCYLGIPADCSECWVI